MSSSCDYVLVDKIRDLAVEDGRSNLSARGQRNAAVIDGGLKAMLEIFRNQYDPEVSIAEAMTRMPQETRKMLS